MATKIKHVNGNKLSLNIPLTIIKRTLIDGGWKESKEDFYPSSKYPVFINLKTQRGVTKSFVASVDGNVVSMSDNGMLPIGVYQVEVTCNDDNGDAYRYMVKAIVEIVDATVDAGIVPGIEFDAHSYVLDGALFNIVKGSDGLSAYEIAVKHGFEGTEEEWLASLIIDRDEEYIFDGGGAPISIEEEEAQEEETDNN